MQRGPGCAVAEGDRDAFILREHCDSEAEAWAEDERVAERDIEAWIAVEPFAALGGCEVAHAAGRGTGADVLTWRVLCIENLYQLRYDDGPGNGWVGR